MTLAQHIQQLRQLVLEHPQASNLPIVLVPHGQHHRQEIETLHMSIREDSVEIEAQR